MAHARDRVEQSALNPIDAGRGACALLSIGAAPFDRLCFDFIRYRVYFLTVIHTTNYGLLNTISEMM